MSVPASAAGAARADIWLRASAGCLVVGAVLATASATGAPPKPVGSLSQLAGSNGCIYAPAAPGDEPSSLGTCAEGFALATPTSVVVTPDGRNVYVVAAGQDAIAVFRRDASSGRLEQLRPPQGCVGELVEGPPCTDARGLFGVASLLVSADGRNLYALSTNHAVTVFQRNPGTGALAELAGAEACVGTGGAAVEICTAARAMDIPQAMAISPDGRNVYVASSTGSLAAFSRDPGRGALRQLSGTAGCVVERREDDEDLPPEDCSLAFPLEDPSAVAVSRDGRNVYVGSFEAITVLRAIPRPVR